MNCVEFEELLASEAHSGLKIPSGQIAGGKFTIVPGEIKDLECNRLFTTTILFKA